MYQQESEQSNKPVENDILSFERWFTPLDENSIFRILQDPSIPEGTFAIHTRNRNEYILTLKRHNEICQIGITCVNTECKYALGSDEPVYFNSLAEIIANLVSSKVKIKVDDGGDLVFKNHLKNPIPPHTWFLVEKNSAEALDYMSKFGGSNFFAVWMTEDREYQLAIRNNGENELHTIIHTKKGYTYDTILFFNDIPLLISYYMKNPLPNDVKNYKGMNLPAPIVYSGFYSSMISSRYEEMSKKDNSDKDTFMIEFSEIDKMSKKNGTTCNTALRSISMPKNRYKNILACDQTRVRIVGTEDDYINANFSNSPFRNGFTSYILSQAPTEETSEDHWLMIIQQKINVIVILTNIEEKGVQKCFKYWPDIKTPLKIGDKYTIELDSETKIRETVHRKIQITEISSGIVQKVHILQFIAWPDFGIPKEPWGIIDLLTQFNKTRTVAENKLALVHCSAGVGRTGAFVALDMLFNKIKHEGVSTIIDIKELVLTLRTQRNGCVTTLEQYKFIYQTIKTYMEWKIGINSFEVNVIN